MGRRAGVGRLGQGLSRPSSHYRVLDVQQQPCQRFRSLRYISKGRKSHPHGQRAAPVSPITLSMEFDHERLSGANQDMPYAFEAQINPDEFSVLIKSTYDLGELSERPTRDRVNLAIGPRLRGIAPPRHFWPRTLLDAKSPVRGRSKNQGIRFPEDQFNRFWRHIQRTLFRDKEDSANLDNRTSFQYVRPHYQSSPWIRFAPSNHPFGFSCGNIVTNSPSALVTSRSLPFR